LFCALAQLVPCEPVIDNDDAPSITLHVFDTSQHIHLGWKQSAATGSDPFTDAATIWAARPFVFSAALSIEIAAMCVNILSTRLWNKRGLLPHQATFFDPCCGSGTTLYAAEGKGYGKIIGSDVNVDFVRGTRRNLEYTRGLQEAIHPSKCALFVKDAAYSALPWRPLEDELPGAAVDTGTAASPSSSPTSPSPVAQADVVFCNLPWNENVGEYYRENEQILGALASEMRLGCECAFVTKESLDREMLLALGLEVGDIVPIGGSVGARRKNPMDRGPGVRGSIERKEEVEEVKEKKRTGDCYVTFCSKVHV
jgi:hypothetical protein